MCSDKMHRTATNETRFSVFSEPHCPCLLAWVNCREFAMGAPWFAIFNTGQETQNSVFPNDFNHLRTSLKSPLSGLEGACRPGVEAQRRRCFPKGFHGSRCDFLHGRVEVAWDIQVSVMPRSAETVIFAGFKANSQPAWNHFYLLLFLNGPKGLFYNGFWLFLSFLLFLNQPFVAVL